MTAADGAAGPGTAGDSPFKAFLSCDIALTVRLKLDTFLGELSDPAAAASAAAALGALRPSASAALRLAGSAARDASSAPDSSSGAPSTSGEPPSSSRPGAAARPRARGDLELFAVAQLWADGEPLAGPVRTGGADLRSGEAPWGEWLSLGVRYRDLPPSTVVAVTVFATLEHGATHPVGGSCAPLFSKKGRLKSGRHQLRLWSEREACGKHPHRTPGRVPASERGQLERLERLLRRFNRGEVPSVPWLDRLAFAEIATLRAREQAARKAAGIRELVVEYPMFEFPVVYHQPLVAAAPGPAAKATDQAPAGADRLIWIKDAEIGAENPAERKQAKLARSLAREVVDKELKPDVAERRALKAILRYPPTRPLDAEAKELLWKFRYSLRDQPAALPKFLRTVDWGDATEAHQAAQLMEQWAPIDPAAALELLSGQFTNDEVRRYAVAVMSRAGDEELALYLLQLVQALRFERRDDSHLAAFLVHRALQCPVLTNFLHWYLVVEWEDQSFAPRAARTHGALEAAYRTLGPRGAAVWDALTAQTELMAQLGAMTREISVARGHARKKERLMQLLSAQGLCGELLRFPRSIPLPLQPDLHAAGVVAERSGVFNSAMAPLRLCFRLADGPGDTEDEDEGPSSPRAEPVVGEAEGGGPSPSSRRRRQRAPRTVTLIYKKGDDLRQDQLCVQMIALMDRLLKRENLDLRLTVYRVLATATDAGLVEFVPSTTLSSVLAEHRSVLRFLARHNPDPAAPYGVRPDALENFIRSSAGYCVITYILGVGDRHLDNLMMTTDGRFFHIDFGFIMGRDPKLFPPPMKLCREMIEGMGGTDSEAYGRFKTYCCEAYNILRKSTPLILNLISLMSRAGIPDISEDTEKVLLKLEAKFQLGLDDEAAVQHFQVLINESASALFEQLKESAHRIAQYWRR